MLDAPKILQITAHPTAIIALRVPRAKIQAVMGPGLAELMEVLRAEDLRPAGPWFTHHLRMAPDVFDFEISVPVSSAVKASGRVRPSQWPAMRVAQAVYRGGYEGLPGAWGEFDAWIAAQGHHPEPDLWERYLAGPESSPDPAAWRTELNRPLLQASDRPSL